MKLEQVLTKDEFKAVQRVALYNNDQSHMPIIAWSLGFVSLAQLEALLDVGEDTSAPKD